MQRGLSGGQGCPIEFIVALPFTSGVSLRGPCRLPARSRQYKLNHFQQAAVRVAPTHGVCWLTPHFVVPKLCQSSKAWLWLTVRHSQSIVQPVRWTAIRFALLSLINHLALGVHSLKPCSAPTIQRKAHRRTLSGLSSGPSVEAPAAGLLARIVSCKGDPRADVNLQCPSVPHLRLCVW